MEAYDQALRKDYFSESAHSNIMYIAWPFTILQNDNITISWDFFRLTVPMCPGMVAGAVSLRKSHDIVILSFCNVVKGQANYMLIKAQYEWGCSR